MDMYSLRAFSYKKPLTQLLGGFYKKFFISKRFILKRRFLFKKVFRKIYTNFRLILKFKTYKNRFLRKYKLLVYFFFKLFFNLGGWGYSRNILNFFKSFSSFLSYVMESAFLSISGKKGFVALLRKFVFIWIRVYGAKI
jgi:hypothetical protein